MAGPAFPASVREEALPFAPLLHKDKAGTFCADKSIDLSHFLFLAIHQSFYIRNEWEVVVMSHHEVYKVISTLSRAIVAGNPPDCPRLLFGQTSPRLRGLTVVQKKHLESVLLGGVPGVVPPWLKDLRGEFSPYSPEANKGPPWVRQRPRPGPRRSAVTRPRRSPVTRPPRSPAFPAFE